MRTQKPEHSNSGFGYVRIGEPDKWGRRRCRTYQVPSDLDKLKIEVDHIDDDPYFGVHKLRAESTLTSNGLVRHERLVGQSADSPHMWFVVVDDSHHSGRNTRSLVAFASEHFPDGTIINEMEFVMLPVSNEQQVGAVQWLKDNGSVEQIYVDPSVRHSDIGQRIVQTAGSYHQVCGWPGALYASGRRTQLGQQFALNVFAQIRVGEHTELSPPMDPPQTP